MDWLIDGPWQVSWMPWQLQPPQWDATFIIKGTFLLQADATAVWHPEQELPSGPQYEDDDPERPLRYAEDFVPWKPRCDVLVQGAVHTPQAQPLPACETQVRIGGWSKRLLAIGDRFWKERLIGSAASVAQPFTRMPLGYDRSFGGRGFAPNPIGRGRGPETDEAGRRLRRLPNFESPGTLITSPRQQPAPAGFGPIPLHWPPRWPRIGHYRGQWFATRWPWYAADLDPRFFNCAPDDQQLAYLRGDEELLLVNQHPQQAQFLSRLPGLQPRCLLTTSAGAQHELPLVLDTCWINGEDERLILVWRGRQPIAEQSAAAIAEVFICEDQLDQRVDLVRARADRIARAEPAPDSATPAAEGVVEDTAEADPGTVINPDEAYQQAMSDLEAALQQAIAESAAACGGQPLLAIPSDLLHAGPAQPPAQDSARINDDIAKALQSFADQAQAEGRAVPEALQQLIDEPPSLPELPAFSDEEPTVPPEALPTGSSTDRASFLALLAEGADLQGRDFSGIDLSQANLRGACLAGAVFCAADFSGAQLDAADFRRCDLSRASFHQTTACDAHFGAADLSQADLRAALLDRACFEEALLIEADASDSQARSCLAAHMRADACRLDRADWSGADLSGASLPGASLQGCRLIAVSAQAADISRAEGEDCDASRADLRKLQAAEASLPGLCLLEAQLDEAVFEQADLRRLRATAACFRRAECSGANFREATLDRAHAPHARFVAADFSHASLLRMNLFQADCQGAQLIDCDAREANCYGAEFWQARIVNCRLAGANLTASKLALMPAGEGRP